MVELDLLNPDPQPYRSFLRFFRANLVACRISCPECCREYKVSRGDQVTQVPDIVDIFRKKPDFTIRFLHLAKFSLHI